MRKLTLLLIAFTFLCQAQEYKAAVLYEASGNIKKIKYQTRDKTLIEYPEFTKDGKFTGLDDFRYDKNGYPLDRQADMKRKDKTFLFYETIIEYNDQNRPISIKDKGQFKSWENFKKEITFEYSEDGYVSAKKALLVDKSDTTNVECKYSHYTFDSKGNWITRSVNQVSISNKEGSKTDNYIESREIEYYK